LRIKSVSKKVMEENMKSFWKGTAVAAFIGLTIFAQISSTSAGSRPSLAVTRDIAESFALESGLNSKVLTKVPYVNQALNTDANGRGVQEPYIRVSYDDYIGKFMCGASAILMVSAYYGKIPKDNDYNKFRENLYKNKNGNNWQSYCNPKYNVQGIFGITSKGNDYCRFNTYEGLTEFAALMGLSSNYYSQKLSIQEIEEEIDNGRPIIAVFDINSSGVDVPHIALIIGYTLENTPRLVVHDPFTDYATLPNSPSFEGKFALYPSSLQGQGLLRGWKGYMKLRNN
jgi:Peptidase_C39 like family